MSGVTVPLGFPYPTGGDPVAASEVEALAEAIDDAMVTVLASAATASMPPAGKVTGTAQVIPDGVGTPIVFNSEYFDNDDMADLVADPFHLTVRTVGVYVVSGSATFLPNLTGYRQIEVMRNGVIVARWASAAVSSTVVGLSANATVLLALAVGDTLGLSVGHTGGVPLSVVELQLSAFRVSP